MPDYQCPHCSRPITADASFCPHCGGRLTLGPSPSPVTPGNPTVSGWVAPSGAVSAPRPWWRRPAGILGVGIAVLLVLGGVASALNAGKTPGGGSSAGTNEGAGTVTTPTPQAPTSVQTDEAEPPADPTVAPPPPAKATSYPTPNDRQWAQIVKSPDKYIGKGYHLWACISQFDAATGSDTFRADASNKKREYWSLDGENALFSGDEDRLSAYVEGDMIVANVTTLGSYSYDTQIGGNTTAPLFHVDSIARKGSCK